MAGCGKSAYPVGHVYDIFVVVKLQDTRMCLELAIDWVYYFEGVWSLDIEHSCDDATISLLTYWPVWYPEHLLRSLSAD